MKNQVTTSRFLSWYFSCYEDIEVLGQTAYDGLKSDGTYTVNVKELFDSCGYIPAFICVDANDEGEYEPNELELING